MRSRCQEADLTLESTEPLDATTEERWRRHFENCSSCRDQIAADMVLRRTFVDTPTLPEPGFEGRLKRELAARAAGTRKERRYSRRLVRRLVASYGTALAGASLWVLSNLPWDAIPMMYPMAALGVAACLTPLLFFDRAGFLRPPG